MFKVINLLHLDKYEVYMSNLKIRFKLHGLEFEAEGDVQAVKEEFADIKLILANSLNNTLINTIPFQESQLQGDIEKSINERDISERTEAGSYPHINDLITKNTIDTESDWLLIHSFYSSEYGLNSFTKEDVKTHYELSKRANKNRFSNFSKNMKIVIRKSYIKSLNDNEFLISDIGKSYINQLLAGDYQPKRLPSPPKTNPKVTKTKQSPKVKKAVQYYNHLSTDEIENLTNFVREKKAKSIKSKLLLILKWYQVTKKTNGLELGELNYALSLFGKVSENLVQILRNLRNEQPSLITITEDNKFKLTPPADLFIKKNHN